MANELAKNWSVLLNQNWYFSRPIAWHIVHLLFTDYGIRERKMPRWFKNPSMLAAAGAGFFLIVSAGNSFAADSPSWDAKLAAKYLDDREVEWQEWDRPHTNSATLCVSCHTQAAYGLARPILHNMTGDETQTPAEKAMLASVIKRVMNWSKMQLACRIFCTSVIETTA
jgi:hypothetical protein